MTMQSRSIESIAPAVSFRRAALVAAFGLVAICTSVSANAAPVPGGGGAGYHAQVFYFNNWTKGVYPTATWKECDDRLRATIAYDINYNHWVVQKIVPCHYTAGPMTGDDAYDHNQDYYIRIKASTPKESLALSEQILGEVREVRESYQADHYDAAMRMIIEAADE